MVERSKVLRTIILELLEIKNFDALFFSSFFIFLKADIFFTNEEANLNLYFFLGIRRLPSCFISESAAPIYIPLPRFNSPRDGFFFWVISWCKDVFTETMLFLFWGYWNIGISVYFSSTLGPSLCILTYPLLASPLSLSFSLTLQFFLPSESATPRRFSPEWGNGMRRHHEWNYWLRFGAQHFPVCEGVKNAHKNILLDFCKNLDFPWLIRVVCEHQSKLELIKT